MALFPLLGCLLCVCWHCRSGVTGCCMGPCSSACLPALGRPVFIFFSCCLQHRMARNTQDRVLHSSAAASAECAGSLSLASLHPSLSFACTRGLSEWAVWAVFLHHLSACIVAVGFGLQLLNQPLLTAVLPCVGWFQTEECLLPLLLLRAHVHWASSSTAPAD